MKYGADGKSRVDFVLHSGPDGAASSSAALTGSKQAKRRRGAKGGGGGGAAGAAAPAAAAAAPLVATAPAEAAAVGVAGPAAAAGAAAAVAAAAARPISSCTYLEVKSVTLAEDRPQQVRPGGCGQQRAPLGAYWRVSHSTRASRRRRVHACGLP